MLPDARDGLTGPPLRSPDFSSASSARLERIILWQLREAQKELGRDSVPTALLYGRVVEHVNVTVEEFQFVLQRLVGTGVQTV